MSESYSNLLQQAKNGDSGAIATLMNRSLQPKGINIQTQNLNGHLLITVKAEHLPDRTPLIGFIRTGLMKLNPSTLQDVIIQATSNGSEILWRESFTLNETSPKISPPKSGNVFEENLYPLKSLNGKNLRVEVIAYRSLQGIQTPEMAQKLYWRSQMGIFLQQVRLFLDQGDILVEPGSLQLMKGKIELTSQGGNAINLGSLVQGVAGKVFANETLFRSYCKGSGTIYLKPTFSHYLLYNLAHRESLLIKGGMFSCCEGSVRVELVTQSHLSQTLLGRENWFQTKVIGPGICVLASPIPESEILCLELNNEKLQISGNEVLFQTEGLKTTLQLPTKEVFDSVRSGEGLMQTYQGTGKVWLAPTQSIY